MRILPVIVRMAYRLFNRKFEAHKSVIIDPRAFIARGGAVNIGAHSIVRAGAMALPSGGHITIGSRTTINQYVILNGQGGITIGNDVMIAAFTCIYAANHTFDRIDIPMRDQGMNTRGGVRIEDDVWIGTHSVILDGVSIGKGAVIAAGSVITCSVAPFSIVAGVPGRVIGDRRSKSSCGTRHGVEQSQTR